MTTRTHATVHVHTWPGPLGALRLLSRDGRRPSGVFFEDGRHAPRPAVGWVEDASPFEGLVEQLERYFAGELRCFRLDLDARGTPFQREVWAALERIPYGTTTSYAELARAVGRPTAVRAVAAANARNPLSIVVPCHRVVGSDGTLTGYAGGLERKRRLLELEGSRSGELFA